MSENEARTNIELINLCEYCPDSHIDVFTGDHYMILFNMKNGLILTFENHPLSLSIGNIVFIRPNTSFQIETMMIEKTEKTSIIVKFHEEHWNALIRNSPEFNYIYDVHSGENLFVLKSPTATWQGLYSALFMLLTEYNQDNVCRKMAIEGLFISTMVHMNRTVYFQKLSTREKNDNEILINDITNYISEHYAEKISLEDLSRIFNISRSKITHLFKKKYSMSFYQIVLQRRLVYAKNAIISGMNISEVAYQSGFSEYTSFYKAFRKTFGMSPKAMQIQFREKVKTPEPF